MPSGKSCEAPFPAAGGRCRDERPKILNVPLLSTAFRKFGDVFLSELVTESPPYPGGSIMLRRSPFVIRLSEQERAELEARCKEYTSPHRDVVRAKIVLLASQGLGNNRIAAQVGMPRQIASKWRQRFCSQRLPGSRRSTPRRATSPLFLPMLWLRSRSWPVSCRHAVVCPWLTGRLSSCARRHWRAASLPRSAAPRSGAGLARTPCGRGAIAVGSFLATRTSPARPAASLICINVVGKAQLRDDLGGRPPS